MKHGVRMKRRDEKEAKVEKDRGRIAKSSVAKCGEGNSQLGERHTGRIRDDSEPASFNTTPFTQCYLS